MNFNHSLFNVVTCGLAFAILATQFSELHAQVNTTPVQDVVSFDSELPFPCKIVNKAYTDRESGRELLHVQTASGGHFLFDPGKVRIRSETGEVHRQYEQKLQTMNDSAEAHHAMLEWIDQQQEADRKLRTSFEPYRTFHLRRIAALDPNDVDAMKKLGFRQNSRGDYYDESLLLMSLGYVPVGSTRFQSSLQSRIVDYEENVAGNSGQFRENWHRLSLRAHLMSDAEKAAAVKSLAKPETVTSLFDIAKNSTGRDQLILLEAIGSQFTVVAGNALMYFAVQHPDANVRDLALSLLQQPGFDPIRRSIVMYSGAQFLSSPDNGVVRRGADLIGQTGDWSIVPELIDAIATTHKFATGADPNRTNVQRNNISGTNFTQGSSTPPVVTRVIENEEVVGALRRITGQDFGNNKAAWKIWYRDNCTLSDLDLNSSFEID